jgi:hypothetical protein
MNIRGKCPNRDCATFGIEKSVFVGQFLGFGVANDRVNCPSCGSLMKTTATLNTTLRSRGQLRSRKRPLRRSSTRY